VKTVTVDNRVHNLIADNVAFTPPKKMYLIQTLDELVGHTPTNTVTGTSRDHDTLNKHLPELVLQHSHYVAVK
jgi:hypothetical protein